MDTKTQITIDLDLLGTVLLAHQRISANRCLCGPQKLGTSFISHQVAMIEAASVKPTDGFEID